MTAKHAFDFETVFIIGKHDTVLQPNVFEIDPSTIPHDGSCWYTNFYNANPKDVTFLYFTSGSTGGPKLVASDHIFWNFNIENTCDRFVVLETDTVGLVGEKIGGIYSMSVFLSTLYKGAKFVMCSIHEGDDGIHVVHHQLLKYQISVCFSTPVFFHYWLQFYEEHTALAKPIAQYLRTVVSAGDILNPEIVDRVMSQTGIGVANYFGASENGGFIGTIYNAKEKSKYGTLGKAMKHAQLAILDDNGNELGDNQEGLIAVKTVNSVAYWNNIEAQCKYVVNGWNVSGDYGYRDGNGDYWFCGRKDFLIKMYGARVPTEQIETSMLQVPGVSQAVIIGQRNKSFAVVLAIVVVRKEYQDKLEQIEAELRTKLKMRFKAHVLPLAYKFVDFLPMTNRGKLDRNALTKQYENEKILP